VTIDHPVPFQRSMSALPAPPPTAKQFVALVQATASSSARIGPGAFGLAMIDHVVPLWRSTSVFWVFVRAEPTAKHSPALVHDTPVSPLIPAAGFTLEASDHVEPFQVSARVRYGTASSQYVPTAVQLVALVHDTPTSWLFWASPAFGLATIDQLFPSQASISVWSTTLSRVGPVAFE
jgi:hypothetical protein